MAQWQPAQAGPPSQEAEPGHVLPEWAPCETGKPLPCSSQVGEPVRNEGLKGPRLLAAFLLCFRLMG